MHRFLFISLRVLSAWPVLVVLLVAITILHWVGAGVQEREEEVGMLLEETVRLKQERTRFEAQLNGLTLTDLRRRSLLYAEDFLPLASDAEASIRAELKPAFDQAMWNLDSVVVEESIEAESELPIGAVAAELSARMFAPPSDSDESPKLPVKTAVGLSQYIWRAPPFKEIQSIRLERTIDGYEMSMGIFVPCRHDVTVAETSLEDLPDGEHLQ